MVDLKDRVDPAELMAELAPKGMSLAVWGRLQPDKTAIHDPDGRTRTFGEVNAAANRIARLIRQAGLKAGDALALLCSNRAEFVEVLHGAQRSGIRITPVNWHLTPEEVAYIVADCEAKALFAEARFAPAAVVAGRSPDLVLKVAIGGDIEGFQAYDAALSGLDPTDIPDPTMGGAMLYTSGTTGRPKGVYRAPGAAAATPPLLLRGEADRAQDVQMCAGPAYHAAPLAFDVRAAMLQGTPLVFIDKWDTEEVLRTIAEKKVTHMHLVPIMFQRLLGLPDAVKARYDVSHVKYVIHGAAPCPPEVKAAMIEWFGPVLSEYYAGSEGGAGFFITSEEWLKKPGSVGKKPAFLGSKILDDEGAECPRGVAGTIYHQLPPGGAFEYYKDPAKTAASRRDGYFTMGDVGYFDEDDYLFLTGRNAETIISGGVNIYPQEVDNEIIKHPAVEDSCVVGIPHDEWGEQVHAVVTLKPGFEPSQGLAQALQALVRDNLAGFKVPRSVEFVKDLPRSAAGKIQRNKVRAPYWEGRARQI